MLSLLPLDSLTQTEPVSTSRSSMHCYSGECSKSSHTDYLQFKWDTIWIIKLNKLQKPVCSVSEQKLSFLDMEADANLQILSFPTICLTGDFRGTVEKMTIRSQSWSLLILGA